MSGQQYSDGYDQDKRDPLRSWGCRSKKAYQANLKKVRQEVYGRIQEAQAARAEARERARIDEFARIYRFVYRDNK